MSLRDAAQNVLTVWDRRAPGERMEWQREWADALLGLSEALAAERGEGGEREGVVRKEIRRIGIACPSCGWNLITTGTPVHEAGCVTCRKLRTALAAPAPSAPPRAPAERFCVCGHPLRSHVGYACTWSGCVCPVFTDASDRAPEPVTEWTAADLLREVLPQRMGGYPDLFYPPGGWEAWEERAIAVLGEPASPAPRAPGDET